MDVEALNGRKDRLSEFGFVCLDSRNIPKVYNNSYEQHISAPHLIIKDAVPKLVNDECTWKMRRFGGNF